MPDQIDFYEMTAEELTGENALQLTSRFYSKTSDPEMNEHLGCKKNDNIVFLPDIICESEKDIVIKITFNNLSSVYLSL